jgi:3'-phosphoadenosine 5'-phosphosulfate sulfotransferase (PAPS reductase)/FAD synthetase
MENKMNLDTYDSIIIAFSGGKDSLACLLMLLDLGVKDRIELWHHDVDGETSDLFDWACTKSYCTAVAKAFDVPIYFSWKEGGLEREMNRFKEPTAPTIYETPDGIKTSGGKSNRLGTRRKFPQVSPDLSVRWCSSYGKIMVMSAGITGQPRFEGKNTLIITGERREESANRSRYAEFQPHTSNCKKRKVDHWRPIIDWASVDVWKIIEKYKVNPHPAYHLGWGRTSCLMCIFASNDQIASAYAIAPERVQRIADYEMLFGSLFSGVLLSLFQKAIILLEKDDDRAVAIAFQLLRSHKFLKTIQRQYSVPERIARGKEFPMEEKDIASATSSEYTDPIILTEWKMPLGATGDVAGPS